MAILLLFILVVVFFANFSQRLTSVESRLRKLEAGEIIVPPARSTPVAGPVIKNPFTGSLPLVTSDSISPDAAAPTIVRTAPAPEDAWKHTSAQSIPMARSSVQGGKSEERGLEFQFGSRVLTSVGVVAVLFGMGYFLRYAFDNGLISEVGRVALGLITGAVLLGLGEWFSRKYPLYGTIMSGGGLGLLYLSLYAGFSFYRVFPVGLSFVGMVLVSILGLFLSSGENHPHILFMYLFVLNLAVLGVAWLRRWRALMTVSLLGTLLVYLGWFWTYFTRDQFGVAMGYASLFFLLFLGSILVRHFRQAAQPDEADILVTMLNAGAYFCIGYDVIHQVYPESVGFFTLLLAFLHIGLALAVRGSNEYGDRLAKLFSAVSVVLFALYAPIEFDTSWVSIGWVAEATVLLMMSLSLRSLWLRNFSLGVFTLAFLRIVAWDAFGGFGATNVPWANSRMLTLLIVLTLYIAVIIFIEVQNHLRKYEEFFDDFGQQAIVFIELQSVGVLLWLGGAEITQFHRSFWLAMFLILVAVVSGFLGLIVKRGALFGAGYLILMLAGLRVIGTELIPGETMLPIFNDRVVSVLGFSLVAWGLVELIRIVGSEFGWDESMQRVLRTFLSVGIFLTTFWMVSSETINFFDYTEIHQLPSQNQTTGTLESMKQVSLSVAWLLYAIAIVALGISRRSVALRVFAITLFGLVVFKVFLYDTASLDNFYRFISFFALGGILLLAGYLYNRYQETIQGFIRVR